MAEWVYVENGEIKEYHSDLPKSWKNISGLNLATMPHLLSLGWYPVKKVKQSYDPKNSREIGHTYEIKDDHVVETQQIENFSTDELAQINDNDERNFYLSLRQQRNYLLRESDWTQTLDIQEKMSEEEKLLWKVYRQNLRDLPDHVTMTNNIPWPLIPKQ